MSESPDREILTIEEAAQLLGVSVKTFNKVLHTQSIPARKIGREWKFSRQALIDWIGAGRSDEFYRDSRDDKRESHDSNGPSDRKDSLRPASPRSVSPSGGERRTSGWQLKLD